MGKDDKAVSMLPAVVFALACVLASIPSDAQFAGPCAETVAKYCGDVTPGGGRIMKCLSDHRADQSIACKDWLEEQSRSLKELKTACPGEIARLCSFDPPDDIRIYQCLDGHYVNLMSNCREKLREIKDRLQ